MPINFNNFKESIDNFFTLPTFEKKDANKTVSELPVTGSSKTYKISSSINQKNAIGAAKVIGFAVFFPLGIGALINTARKWHAAPPLKNRVSNHNPDSKKESTENKTDEVISQVFNNKTNKFEDFPEPLTTPTTSKLPNGWEEEELI